MRRCCVLLLGLAWALAAQETRGMIFGRVMDPQGSTVAGVKVIVTNADTNTSTPVTTNETGYYQANLLMPGNYQVTAEGPGLRTNNWSANVRRDFRLQERLVFQARLEALNIVNRTQFAAPVTNPPATNFAAVTVVSQTNKRSWQLTGRLTF